MKRNRKDTNGKLITKRAGKLIENIYNLTQGKNTFKNSYFPIDKKIPEKNPSYYDDDKSDGITIDKDGNISFHGRKGLKVMKQRQKDGLSTTNVVKPRISKSK